jgi:hypothetical protein
MCWSSTLARFFVITEVNVFTVDDNTMFIEPIQINQEQSWCSCTCSDTSLFLSSLNHGSSILKFSLFPFIQFEKQWNSSKIGGQNQMIMYIACQNETLALTVADVDKEEKLIELRLSTTFERLWSLKLDVEYSAGLFRCCFLNHGDWLVWNWHASHFLHITKDGKLHSRNEYYEIPLCVILFDGDQLGISTANEINFHRIKS